MTMAFCSSQEEYPKKEVWGPDLILFLILEVTGTLSLLSSEEGIAGAISLRLDEGIEVDDTREIQRLIGT